MPTVFAARQFVNHGHVKVNGRRVNIASYQVKVGDLVEIKESSKQLALVLEANALAERDVPDYVEVDHAKGTAKLTRVPRPVGSALSDPDGAEPRHRILFALTFVRLARSPGRPHRWCGRFGLLWLPALVSHSTLRSDIPIAQAWISFPAEPGFSRDSPGSRKK